jgi:hypothetical protein
MTISRFHLLLLTPALAVAFATGCGGDDNSGNGEPTIGDAQLQQEDQAAALAKQAANRIVQATPDKNLPGPKNYKAVCLQRGDPDAGTDIPANAYKCHIEAFYGPYKGESGGYIWSEDWLIPIKNGKLGPAVIHGEYRIRNFLREDNKRNCTGRHRPHECLPQSVGGQLPG